MDPPTEVLRLQSNGLEVAPIIAPLAFTFDGGTSTGLLLDAWTRIAVLKGVVQVISNSPWNFWAGNQTSVKIWLSLRAELVTQMAALDLANCPQILSLRLLQKGRFGFDPGPAWNALDVGFSLNEHGVEVESSPATEMLAAVGLQRFRPVMNGSRDGFDYFTWDSACSPSVAAAAMAGAIQNRMSRRFRASVISRGQYAALSFAYPLNAGDTDE
jgi:CRISPR-associated protein Csx14